MPNLLESTQFTMFEVECLIRYNKALALIVPYYIFSGNLKMEINSCENCLLCIRANNANLNFQHIE